MPSKNKQKNELLSRYYDQTNTLGSDMSLLILLDMG